MLRCLTGLLSTICLASAAVRAADFYVATTGDDTQAGTEAQPFATLARARDEIRKRKQAGPLQEAVTVHVSGGIYALPHGLKLDAQDSGTASAPVVYRACGTERPILIGGLTITGFTPHQGQILKADAAAQGFRGIAFRQLIFDGQRQHLARYPNFDAQNPYGGGWAYAEGKFVPMYQARRYTHFFRRRAAVAAGPNVRHASAKSAIRCIPIHMAFGPGGPSWVRPRWPPRRPIR